MVVGLDGLNYAPVRLRRASRARVHASICGEQNTSGENNQGKIPNANQQQQRN